MARGRKAQYQGPQRDWRKFISIAFNTQNPRERSLQEALSRQQSSGESVSKLVKTLLYAHFGIRADGSIGRIRTPRITNEQSKLLAEIIGGEERAPSRQRRRQAPARTAPQAVPGTVEPPVPASGDRFMREERMPSSMPEMAPPPAGGSMEPAATNPLLNLID